jgi:hypothetical protein
MKNFSLRTFIVSTVIIVVIAFESFFTAFANTTGEAKHDFLTKLSDVSITVFNFPINYLVSKLNVETGFIIYFFLLFINCLLYSLLIERLFSFFKNKKSKIPLGQSGI